MAVKADVLRRCVERAGFEHDWDKESRTFYLWIRTTRPLLARTSWRRAGYVHCQWRKKGGEFAMVHLLRSVSFKEGMSQAAKADDAEVQQRFKSLQLVMKMEGVDVRSYKVREESLVDLYMHQLVRKPEVQDG